MLFKFATALAIAILTPQTNAINVVLSNDDGWAQKSIRCVVAPPSSAFHTYAARQFAICMSGRSSLTKENIRTFYDVLTANGFNIIISAPAFDQSGSGSDDDYPKWALDGCQFHSCPDYSRPTGQDLRNPNIYASRLYSVFHVEVS